MLCKEASSFSQNTYYFSQRTYVPLFKCKIKFVCPKIVLHASVHHEVQTTVLVAQWLRPLSCIITGDFASIPPVIQYSSVVAPEFIGGVHL